MYRIILIVLNLLWHELLGEKMVEVKALVDFIGNTHAMGIFAEITL
jgi:hypothetical protein